jgi:GH15 family glucan-1,4-alpha-glucosidase
VPRAGSTRRRHAHRRGGRTNLNRIDGYAPIRDYALIGDGRTCALVARDGAIDWFPIPNIDSPAVFARILDAQNGGAFELQPEEPFEVERCYEEGSNVLVTTFRTASGAVRVTDALVLTDTASLAPMRELVRKIEGVSGVVPVRWRVEPRFDFGRGKATRGTRSGRFFACCGADALSVNAWDAGDVQIENGTAAGSFALRSGSEALIDVAVTHREPAVIPSRRNAERRLERTMRFWPEWSRQAQYDGPWRGPVVRSALVLKLLCFAPSGAIVAAPTASLPEWIGGGRNWDYRYSWVRDATWTLDALLRLGYRGEAEAYFWWFMHASRLTQPRLQILYRTDGSTRTDEQELDELAGYRGSAPVRIGNGAADQVQLDVYGSMLDAVCRYAGETGRVDGDTGKEIARIADYVAEHWRDKDSGIWEVRSTETHFIQSKALCWVALDRACTLARDGVIPERSDRWRREAEAIREFVDANGWDDERMSYVRAPDMRELDASLLTMNLLRYDDPNGVRPNGVIEAVKRELAEGPFVYRYRGEDGVAGREGAFLTCSFWLVDALARARRLDEACRLMDELVALANDVGLYSEEMDPESRDFLGNFPQGLTHLALVNAAVSIEDAKTAR